jgi:hypothetical protein
VPEENLRERERQAEVEIELLDIKATDSEINAVHRFYDWLFSETVRLEGQELAEAR